MTIQASYSGGLSREPNPTRLTTTGNTDIYTATDNTVTVAGFGIANETGSAVAISVFWYNLTNTTSYLIWRGSIAADATEIVSDIPQRMRTGDKITATAATGNALTVNPKIIRQGRNEVAANAI